MSGLLAYPQRLEGLGDTFALAGEVERAAVVYGAPGAMRAELATVLFPPDLQVRAG